MDSLISLLGTLNTLSPLAVIALLSIVIFMMIKGKHDVESHVNNIQTNDLHELPAMAENIRSMTESLQRMEVSMSENFAYIKARINGGGPRVG